MRHLALLVSLVCGCQHAPRATSPPSPIAATRPAESPTIRSVRISAKSVGSVDSAGDLVVLISVQNTSNERLVLSRGGAADDWFTSYTAYAETNERGVAGAHWSTDQAGPGDIVCPQPEYALVLPPGGTVGRLQRIPIAEGLEAGAPHMQIRVRILITPSSLRCGPLRYAEHAVDVAFEPGDSISFSK